MMPKDFYRSWESKPEICDKCNTYSPNCKCKWGKYGRFGDVLDGRISGRIESRSSFDLYREWKDYRAMAAKHRLDIYREKPWEREERNRLAEELKALEKLKEKLNKNS